MSGPSPAPSPQRAKARSGAASHASSQRPLPLNSIAAHLGHLPACPSSIPVEPDPRLHLQRKLAVGSSSDPLEAEADRIAADVMRTPGSSLSLSAPAPALRRKCAGESSEMAAPPIVHRVLESPGQPLDAGTLSYMEPRFQADFSRVRVHTGALAAESARAVNALAYTVGNDLVFSSGQYQPHSSSGGKLLAHELAHVAQQTSAPMPWVQRQKAAGGAPKPRKDYVFLMGADPAHTGNPFYKEAADYFHAHLPTATFVDDQRSLAEMLRWISSNVKDPIGDLYIVSHGGEDGTLGFGLNSLDTSARLTVNKLRDALHPAGGGSSALQTVGSVIDAQTTIHIKGCDIGRTRQMVELIDEAFGGAGTVTAPTHEQEYSTDPQLGQQARKTAHDKQIGDFTATLPPVPPQPAPVDRKLKGEALKKAIKEHDDAAAARKTAEAARKTAIAGEEKRIKPDLDVIEKKAETIDALSGPMFQRPGKKLFTAAELQPEIDRLYPQLSDTQRKSLAQRLAAPDHGTKDDQQGQKVDRSPVFSNSFLDPQSLAEGKAIFGAALQRDGFVAKAMTATKTTGPAGSQIKITFTGTAHPKGAAPFDSTWQADPIQIPDENALLAQAKGAVNNPDRFQWQVERKHDSSGKTMLSAFGERVKAYLHHGSLDPGPHQHFGEPESNADFYVSQNRHSAAATQSLHSAAAAAAKKQTH